MHVFGHFLRSSSCAPFVQFTSRSSHNNENVGSLGLISGVNERFNFRSTGSFADRFRKKSAFKVQSRYTGGPPPDAAAGSQKVRQGRKDLPVERKLHLVPPYVTPA